MKGIPIYLVALGMVALVGCADEPYGDGENQMPEPYGGPGVTEEGLMTCGTAADCHDGEACTSGGLCINITGEEDVTAVLHKELSRLPDPVGAGVPYRLPPNSILRLEDQDGDGVALRIDRAIDLDGAGSLFLVPNGVTAISIEEQARETTLRNFRVDPLDPESAHEGVGIQIKAPGVLLDNLHLWRMGTAIFASSELSSHPDGVRRQYWNRLVIEESYQNATYLGGDQSAGGLILGTELSGGGGHIDESEHSTYVGVSARNSAGSIHLENPDSTSTVTGLVTLGDTEGPTSQSEYDVFLGGNRIADLRGPADRVGQGASILHFADPEDGELRIRIPGEEEDSALSWETEEEGLTWALQYLRNRSWGVMELDTGRTPLELTVE